LIRDVAARREKLALLCQEHELARDACRRALTQADQQVGPMTVGAPVLTHEQKTMVRNILAVVDRLEADVKNQHEARKQSLYDSVERAFRREGVA
jgi:hypothetical protein